ncbi:MAG: TetR/AcrR family transcriptional regulator [Planctomycetota bacterium]
MQVRSEKKRGEIMSVAARLFASKPFHEVRLEHVAAQARVGKGTLYVYFSSKEQLYAAVVAEGIAALADAIDLRLSTGGGGEVFDDITLVVESLLDHAARHPHLFALLRSGHPIAADAELLAQRARLAASIERSIRRGVERGEIDDPHPELTAHYLLSMVRAALLFGPARLSREAVGSHILGLLRRGLAPATTTTRRRKVGASTKSPSRRRVARPTD